MPGNSLGWDRPGSAPSATTGASWATPGPINGQGRRDASRVTPGPVNDPGAGDPWPSTNGGAPRSMGKAAGWTWGTTNGGAGAGRTGPAGGSDAGVEGVGWGRGATQFGEDGGGCTVGASTSGPPPAEGSPVKESAGGGSTGWPSDSPAPTSRWAMTARTALFIDRPPSRVARHRRSLPHLPGLTGPARAGAISGSIGSFRGIATIRTRRIASRAPTVDGDNHSRPYCPVARRILPRLFPSLTAGEARGPSAPDRIRHCRGEIRIADIDGTNR